MRELEFLPAWYQQVRRRRLAVIVQAWATAGLALVLLVWTGVARFRVVTSHNELADLKKQMAVTQVDLTRLDVMNQQKHRWDEEDQVLERLGISVESTRLMGMISQAAPASVALIGLNMQTEEKASVPTSVAQAKAMTDKSPVVDRKLRVRVDGVAPSDAEVADLMAKLAAMPFLEDVSMNFSKDSDQNGRAAREFEVTFAMDLNAAVQ